jgi:hypothetical protein
MTWGQNERNKTLEQNDTPVSVPFDYFSFPESRPANFLSSGSSATASNILTGCGRRISPPSQPHLPGHNVTRSAEPAYLRFSGRVSPFARPVASLIHSYSLLKLTKTASQRKGIGRDIAFHFAQRFSPAASWASTALSKSLLVGAFSPPVHLPASGQAQTIK